ncbi:TRAP transporter small permease [Phaeovulum sp. W22_SRMD_FR3]
MRQLASAAAILLFIIMMTAVLVQVAGRYLFNFSIAQAAEIATYAQIWLVMLGAGVALARGQHVAIDLLPAMLPRPMQRGALLAIVAVSAAFLLVLGYGSLPLLRMGAFQLSATLRIPMQYIYLCLPISAFYMLCELALSLVQRWPDPFPPITLDEEEAL